MATIFHLCSFVYTLSDLSVQLFHKGFTKKHEVSQRKPAFLSLKIETCLFNIEHFFATPVGMPLAQSFRAPK